MDKKGKNLDDLQDLNRAQVIRFLAMHEGCSRVELAKATGLKQGSITKIMRSLMDAGVVVETGFTEGLKGRRSIGLSLNYSRRLVVGIKIAWKRLSIGLFDLRARPVGELYSCAFDYLDRVAADNVVALIADTVGRLARRHPEVVAIGAAVPGPFHRGDGSVYLPGDGGGRIYYPFLRLLRQRITLPLVMDHDANAGALGYWWFRTNCDTRIALLYLLMSEGVGGGVVSKGQIFTGQRGHSAEIGHVLVEHGGRPCVCGGRGCLDAYASSLAVENAARERIASHPESSLPRRQRIPVSRIFSAMRDGDAFAASLVREAGEYMGRGLASLLPVFDPDLVVISDLMAGGGDVLLDGITASLDRHLSPYYKQPRLELAVPDDDIVLLGSAAIAINHVFSNPTELLMGREGGE